MLPSNLDVAGSVKEHVWEGWCDKVAWKFFSEAAIGGSELIMWDLLCLAACSHLFH